MIRLSLLLLPLLLTLGVQAAPQWDRYGQQGGERNIPGAIPGAMPDMRGGSGQPPQPTQQFDAAQEARRQVNRMSPEDRRNLRRQINEAGQDIYQQRR